jgi:hypothetical protein
MHFKIRGAAAVYGFHTGSYHIGKGRGSGFAPVIILGHRYFR